MLIGFRWILPGRLAGGGQPGLLRPIERDLAFLREEGVRTLVMLTEKPLVLPADWSDAPVLVHFPIDDMGIPTPRALVDVCRRIVDDAERGEAVLVHCRAGLGRTGTVLACCLVLMGRSAEEAIAEVRRHNAAYMQTPVQERFVGHFADFIGSGACRRRPA